MDRILEPELMDDDEQAKAYTEADFSEPHQKFVTLFKETFPDRHITGYVLDLGCGSCDVTIRFAKAFPDCVIHAVDGSAAMLGCAGDLLKQDEHLQRQVSLIYGLIPSTVLPQNAYDVVLSNSLLHHLDDPSILWDTVKRYVTSGTIVYIVDLMRPDTKEDARMLVDRYAGGEPTILQRDFYNSLLASFEPDEIRSQLKSAGLDNLSVRKISNRHVLVSGIM